MEQMKRSLLGQSYWEHQGAYQKELDELNEKMPLMGAADTLNGELVRAINRLYYDYCNNGNMNACKLEVDEVCTGFYDEYGDEEYEEEETREWNPYYKKFFDLINDTLWEVRDEFDWAAFEKNMSRLDEMVTAYEPGYTEAEMNVYDFMVDAVVWYVLNHEDRELPENYEKE